MRKESLKKDSRNGSNDDGDSVNAGEDNSFDDAKPSNGRENGSNGSDDPLSGDNNTPLDPFDELTAGHKNVTDSISKRVRVEAVEDDDEEADSTEKVNGDNEGISDDGADEVEDIIDHKYKGKRKKMYLIRWKGYGAEYDSWEPESSLNCPEVVARYLETHPEERPPERPRKEKKEKKVKAVPRSAPRDTPKRSVSAHVSFAEDVNKGDEVEEILNHKIVKSEKLYLVSWKGFSVTQNSWELASALDCDDLIAEYEAQNKTGKKKKGGKGGKGGKKSAKKSAPKDYEVEKVIDDKTVNGKKVYRIRWKGYGAKDDTWEPSSMLSCPELIKAYQKKKKAQEAEEDYEVEKILGHKNERGKKFYLVKWKGYSGDENTWEPEASLSCPDLIKKYNEKGSPSKGKKRSAKAAGLSKEKGGDAKKARRPGPKSRRGANDSDDDDAEEDDAEEDDEESEEYDEDDATNDSEQEWEVQDIMDMRTVKGNKQYLIRWKGCKASDDTWEPEEQVNCPDIIARFLKKKSPAKNKATGKKSSKRA